MTKSWAKKKEARGPRYYGGHDRYIMGNGGNDTEPRKYGVFAERIGRTFKKNGRTQFHKIP